MMNVMRIMIMVFFGITVLNVLLSAMRGGGFLTADPWIQLGKQALTVLAFGCGIIAFDLWLASCISRQKKYSAYLRRDLPATTSANLDGGIWYQLFPAQEIIALGIGYRKLAETEEEQKAQDEWLKYVNDTLAKHGRYSALLLVNDYMDADGLLTAFGQLIENEVIKKNQNVRLILSSCESGAIRTAKAYGARTVNALAFNYAADENNGLGFLRLLTFNPETRSITVRTYSPVYNKNTYDEDNPQNDSFTLINAY